MKTKLLKIGLSAGMLSFSFFASAQFTLTGEVRPRTEYRHGFSSVADSAQKAAVFTEQRSRLYFGYQSEFINSKITLQDVRVWGSQTNVANNDGATTAIHEAWAEALLSKKWAMKFGRQEIAYDDDRIFGTLDWAQQGRRHDAVVFKYQDSTFTAHIGGAYNQDKVQNSSTNYTVAAHYKAIQYLWLHKDFKNAGVSALFLNNGIQVNNPTNTVVYKDNYSQTAGLRASYKKDKLSAFTYYYHQFGVSGDWANTKINAYNFAGEASYQVHKSLSASLGLEMLSGNDFTDKSNLDTTSYTKVLTQKAFNPFYGTNHKFNGHMDQFYVGNHVGSVGLNDIYVKLNYKHEKFLLGADVHYFMANGKVKDSKKYAEGISDALTAGTNWKDVEIPAMSSSLGTEIDLYYGFNLVKGVAVKGGYSHILNTETLSILKGVKDYKGIGRTDQVNNWAWVMIIVKPVLFISPNK